MTTTAVTGANDKIAIATRRNETRDLCRQVRPIRIHRHEKVEVMLECVVHRQQMRRSETRFSGSVDHSEVFIVSR